MFSLCRKDIDYFCVMHVTGNGLFSQSKGRPTKSDSRQKLQCSQILNEKILELRKDFSLHDDTKMLVMLSISTNDMNRYVSMYPEVWFIDEKSRQKRSPTTCYCSYAATPKLIIIVLWLLRLHFLSWQF